MCKILFFSSMTLRLDSRLSGEMEAKDDFFSLFFFLSDLLIET